MLQVMPPGLPGKRYGLVLAPMIFLPGPAAAMRAATAMPAVAVLIAGELDEIDRSLVVGG